MMSALSAFFLVRVRAPSAQHPVLHLANHLMRDPRTTEAAKALDDLIPTIDGVYHFEETLNWVLGDLHLAECANEPKPRVMAAFKLKSGTDLDSLLDALRQRGHDVAGHEVQLNYHAGDDTYSREKALDLAEEIRNVERELGHQQRATIEPVYVGDWLEEKQTKIPPDQRH